MGRESLPCEELKKLSSASSIRTLHHLEEPWRSCLSLTLALVAKSLEDNTDLQKPFSRTREKVGLAVRELHTPVVWPPLLHFSRCSLLRVVLATLCTWGAGRGEGTGNGVFNPHGPSPLPPPEFPKPTFIPGL